MSQTPLMAPALIVLAAAISQPCWADEAPVEPTGIWQGEINGKVPATIAGGAVVTAEELLRLVRNEKPVLIDVLPSPRRPPEQTTPWLPPQHKNIHGSLWIPGAGSSVISATMELYLRERLAQLTNDDRDRVLVFYCRPDCWASWNAAKRAIEYGYRRVRWFPGGVDAWQSLGEPIEAALPEGPAVQ